MNLKVLLEYGFSPYATYRGKNVIDKLQKVCDQLQETNPLFVKTKAGKLLLNTLGQVMS